MSGFKRATKTQSKLRLALYGPSGSGKTYTSIVIAQALGEPVAVIDTERGTASKYAGDVAEFDVMELTSFEPQRYIAAIGDAAKAGYPTLVIDSLSHAWVGKGGLLDQADAKGGRFDAWRGLTPQHNALIDAILAYRGDVIVTLRSKTEYVVEKDDRGKNAPRKIGLAPVQKEGLEYEFDVAASLSAENVLTVEKTRCPALRGAIIRNPGVELAATLRAWLSDGAAPAAPTSQPDSLVDSLQSSVDYAADIRGAQNPGELLAAWSRIPRAQQKVFASIKDARKAELQFAVEAAANGAAQ
jgi:hypothetical protein